MFGALRLVTVQKGLDPRDFALVAFGGAGPLHGNAIGTLAGCFPVIVPPTPGVLSALGFLYSDIKNEFAQTFIRNLDEVQPNHLTDILGRLGGEAKAWLEAEGIEAGKQDLRYQADVRYFRQGYEFALDVSPEALMNGGLRDLQDRFGAAHERQYGFKLSAPVELVNLRAIGTGRVTKMAYPKVERSDGDPSHALADEHRVYFDGDFVASKIYDRAKLTAGNKVRGPAVIMQTDSTTVIHPGHVGEVDEYLNILILPEGAGG
jgi:N-methylhydantoinase A